MCDNDNRNCLLPDDGWDAHIGVQNISKSLVRKYFRTAVLSLGSELHPIC